MKTDTAKVLIPTKCAEWELWALGDVHFGSQACDLAAFKADVEHIAQTDLAYWFGLGDFNECITFDDPRFEPEMHNNYPLKDYVLQATKGVAALVKPIAHKCLCGITGNHEEDYAKRHHFDSAAYFYGELGIPYYGYSGLVFIKVQAPAVRTGHETVYGLKLYAHHGYGGGRKKGQKLNKVHDLAEGFEADIYAMGHVHDKLADIQPMISVNRYGNMTSREIGYMIGGTYNKTYLKDSTTDGERKAYRPVAIGSPHLRIKMNKWNDIKMRGVT